MSTDRERLIRKQAVISASPETAWKTWTSLEGVTSFLAPRANIEPKLGGLYELMFEPKAPKGFRGTEGSRILRFDPPSNLAFEFLAPPEFPNVRRVRTRVELALEEVLKGGVVNIRLLHSGFMEGEEWDECLDFFNWSWDLALARLQYRISISPIDWTRPYNPPHLGPRPHRKLRDHVSA